MTIALSTDLVVIGGGMAGHTAALKAAQHGLKVVLVEAGFLGGTCLNSGCIPTKYLLGASAHLHKPLQPWEEDSLPCSINLENLQKTKAHYIETCRTDLAKELAEQKITVVQGKASFASPQTLTIKTAPDEKILQFKHCAIATGSAPSSFPNVRADGAAIMGSSTAINLTSPPKTLLLIGGGPISIELGCFFHRLGTQIILVDSASSFLPAEEPEIANTVQKFYESLGWQFFLGKEISKLSTENNCATLIFADDSTLVAEKALVAIGRKPSALNLNLQQAGIETSKRGFINIDKYLACAKNIYAIGDCNGETLLANAAVDQAEYIANFIAGQTNLPYTPSTLPMCVYGTMEFLRVGNTKSSLQRQGFQVDTSTAYFNKNHLAQSLGYPQGLVKALWVDNKLVGISAVGHGCSHLSSLAAILVRENLERGLALGVAVAIPSLDETLKSAIISAIRSDIEKSIST